MLKPLNLYKTLPTTKAAGNAPVWRYLLPPLECPYQKTVVLDLDLTLVNTVIAPKGGDRSAIRHDIVLQLDDPPYDHDIYVLKRPFVDEFLKRLNKNGFEIVVFTAGLKAYASRVLDFLDPSRSLIKHQLYRDSCTAICGGAAYIKNLFHLGRDLRMVVVVDDDPISYCLNPSRAIPIKPFLRYGDDLQDDDDELMNLMGYFCENRYGLCFEMFNNTKNYRNTT